MKKAVILGASGGMGYNLVYELLNRENIEVVAVARNTEKMKKMFHRLNDRVSIVAGDALHRSSILQACEGAEWIFHAINIPYPQWDRDLLIIMENVLAAAKKEKAKLVVVDNIYAYGRSNGKTMSETDPKNPHTKKGKIRLRLAEMVEKSGVDYLIAHFPDFYGPCGEKTLLHHTLKKVVQNKRSQFIGDLNIPREYIFLPDGAKALVELALRDDTYHEHWNIPGAGVISGREIIQILREKLQYEKKVSVVTKSMIYFLGLFSPMMKEMVEMMYLVEEPVVLSGEKFEKRIGPLPKTPYEQGIIATVDFMKHQEEA
ncbi:SDR family NAD(P)-dependent oxidoreductase [Aeribacillus sp. FSL K6-8210]|uniref:SDR family NAD(P)-dependent oxidoreductase n=1 Tax=Aeribacillus sp. FSL K6-8210 TaxID=2954683 RepID=UPI0030D15A54